MHVFDKIFMSLLVITSLSVSTDAKNCTCVPFFQCSDEGDVVSDGRGLIGIRNSECDGFFDVCCKLPRPSTTEPPSTPSKGCGHLDTFPWTSSLLFKPLPNYIPIYKCRVSLIHGQVAITAAHCLQKKGHYQVKVNGVLRTVIHTHIHPSFHPESLQNDIAILVLDKPFNVEKTGTVCIPPLGTVLEGVNCTTATTDSTKEMKGARVIDLPLVSRADCVESLRRNRLGRFFQLHESFICAGGASQDTCEGDGGSPLICPIAGLVGRYHQVGIVSWGVECGGSVPGVYVNLALFRGWIDEVMGERGFDLLSYRV